MSASLAARERHLNSVHLARDLLPVPTGALEIHDTEDVRALKLSVVIPTFNERENLRRLVQRLTEALEETLAGAYEIIVVDDNSPDGTWAAARRLTSELPRLQVMRRAGERGLSTAVIRGWQAARGEVLAVLEPRHPPEILGALLRQIDRGVDLAVARGGGSEGSFLHRIARMFGALLLPEVIDRVSDPMSGCFMVRRSAIAGARMSPPISRILVELLVRGRIFRIAEVGDAFGGPLAGGSRVTWRGFVDYLRHLLRLRLRSAAVGP